MLKGTAGVTGYPGATGDPGATEIPQMIVGLYGFQ